MDDFFQNLEDVYAEGLAEMRAGLRERKEMQAEKARCGHYARQYGRILNPDQPPSPPWVSAEQMQFCHRYLRRQVAADSLVGRPSKRTVLGKTFITACDRATHSVKTDEWQIVYDAINSPDGWRYHFIRFEGDHTVFANDLMMIRTTR